jgi:hypothetical protein
MKVISRKDAAAQGIKRYFTGKPCLRGHVAERRVVSRDCVLCRDQRKLHSEQTQPRSYLAHKYRKMRRRITGRAVKSAHLYKGLGIMPREEFLAWAVADSAFKSLWATYQLAGRPMRLSPSIDRIDTQRGYVRGNVQFITHSANSRKAALWKYYGLNPITKAAA